MRILWLSIMLSTLGCSEYFHEAPTKVYTHNPIEDISPTEVEDVFMQNPVVPYDVLFVIDKSCSMGDDVQIINEEIASFFGELNSRWIDYRVGVISMSGDPTFAGLLGYHNFSSLASDYTRWVEPFMADPVGIFSSLNNDVPYDGEKGLDALGRFIQLDSTSNEHFIRTNSNLLIILISDENDSSTTFSVRDVSSGLDMKSNYLNTDIQVVGIIKSSTGKCELATYEMYGYVYEHFLNVNEGLIIDMCDIDWAQTLITIANYSPPRVEFCLSSLPIVETINVLIETLSAIYNPLPPDWWYDEVSNCITISNFPVPAASKIKISYTKR